MVCLSSEVAEIQVVPTCHPGRDVGSNLVPFVAVRSIGAQRPGSKWFADWFAGCFVDFGPLSCQCFVQVMVAVAADLLVGHFAVATQMTSVADAMN